MKKKILSLLLASSLAFSSLTAFAETTNANDSTNSQTTTENSDDVVVNKDIKDNGDGTFTVTLESYAIAKETEVSTSTPTDFVLVIDQSSAMNNKFSGESQTKQQAMEQAIIAFVNNLKADGGDHKVAIVSYGESDSTATTEFGLTQVNSITDANITALECSAKSTSRNINNGMSTAQTILANSKTNGREQVVIVLGADDFTDFSTRFTRPKIDNVNSAVATAKALKTAGANVYSIDIYSKYTSATQIANIMKKTNYGGDNSATNDTEIAVRFMQLLSSNSTTASSMGMVAGSTIVLEWWEITDNFGWTNGNFHKSASSVDSLKSALTGIADTETPGTTKTEITTTCTLDSAAVLKDEVSKYFTIVEGSQSSNANVTGNTVTATGFDYKDKAYFVADDATVHGEKLVVTYMIKAVDGFVGGNKVDTNTQNSGLYQNNNVSTAQKAIVDPKVDIEINFDPQLKGITIYEGNTLSMIDLYSFFISDYKSDFVTARIGIYDENGNYVNSDFENLSECTNFEYSWEFTPKYSGIATQKIITKDFTAHVINPTIETTDLWLNYGTGINMDKNNLVTLDYKDSCDCTATSKPAVTGNKPELSIVYTDKDGNQITDFANYTVNKEETVKATILINGKETNYTSEFDLYLNRFNLNITKTVNTADWAQYGQDIIVNVIHENGSKTQVAFAKEELSAGTATKTIEGLYAGELLEIKEDSNWSWRSTPTISCEGNNSDVYFDDDNYFCVEGLNKVTKKPTISDVTLKVSNEVTNKKWLSFSEMIKNVFGGKK